MEMLMNWLTIIGWLLLTLYIISGIITFVSLIIANRQQKVKGTPSEGFFINILLFLIVIAAACTPLLNSMIAYTAISLGFDFRKADDVLSLHVN